MKLLNIQINKLFSIGSINHPLDNLGLVMVNGYSKDEDSANGSGKSSFARNSLLWGLYGKGFGEAKGDDVVNRHTDGKNAFIEIDLLDDNSVPYKIRRSRNPAKIEIWRNGINVTPKQDAQELINSIIGRTFDSFAHLDFFGQGKKDSFMELTSTSQREIIEGLLQFKKLDKWQQTAESYKSALQIELNLQQLYIAGLENQMRMLDISTLKAKCTEWDETHDIKVMEYKIRTLEHDIQSTKTQLANLAVNYVNIDLPSLQAESTVLAGELNKISEGVAEFERNIIMDTKDISSLNQSILQDTCTTCKQVLHASHKNEIEYKIRLLELSIRANSDARFMAKKREQALTYNLMQINGQINKFYLDQSEIDRVQAYLDKQMTELEGKKALQLQLVNPFTPLLCKAEAEFQALSTKHLDAQTRKVSIEKAIEAAHIWVGFYSKDFRLFLLNQACPFLEDRTNAYLKLLNNGQLTVSFETVKELKSGKLKDDLSVTVSSKTGASMFSLLSGGEQQMVNFAISLALSDLAQQKASSSNIMVLDEPFTNLDPKNCENVVNFINQHLRNRKDTILFISNEENLRELIPNRIYIEKQNGVSSLVGA